MIAIIEVTTKDREQAVAIGRTLVQERLAACVNVVDGASSIYEWNGQLCEEREAVLLAKTRHELVETVIQRVKQLHTYDCPCIVSWDIAQGSASYVKWVDEQTSR